jgi:hypothetical protein
MDRLIYCIKNDLLPNKSLRLFGDNKMEDKRIIYGVYKYLIEEKKISEEELEYNYVNRLMNELINKEYEKNKLNKYLKLFNERKLKI